MSEFISIDVVQAELKRQKGAVLVDIRDNQSFQTAHVVDAFHLTDQTLLTLLNDYDYDTPILVLCYHGISSRGAAQYLVNQGFEEIYSVEGGFEAWLRQFPEHVEFALDTSSIK